MEIQEVDMTKDQEEQDAKEKEDELPMASQLSLEGPSSVRYGHGGGWSRKINAWHLHTLMVYL